MLKRGLFLGRRSAFLIEVRNLEISGRISMVEGLAINHLCHDVSPAPGASAWENALCHRCPLRVHKWGISTPVRACSIAHC